MSTIGWPLEPDKKLQVGIQSSNMMGKHLQKWVGKPRYVTLQTRQGGVVGPQAEVGDPEQGLSSLQGAFKVEAMDGRVAILKPHQ